MCGQVYRYLVEVGMLEKRQNRGGGGGKTLEIIYLNFIIFMPW